jgi:hypothetical protein
VLRLNPRWSAEGGNWDFGGTGALTNLTPVRPHDVTNAPAIAGTIPGPRC